MAGGKFKILAGPHEDVGGRKFHANGSHNGNIVESPLDLDTMFANKFERVGGKTKEQMDREHFPDASGAVMDDPLEVAEKRRQEEMIDTTPGVSKRPRSDRNEEGQRARGVDPTTEETKKVKKSRKAEVETESDHEEGEEGDGVTIPDEYGMDVTDDFSVDTEKVRVFKGEDGYRFVKSGKSKAANKDPFTSKKEAREYAKEKFSPKE